MTYGWWELTLVHELVRYRLAEMDHDRVNYHEFLDRVKEIMVEGKRFELTHIKAGCPHSSDVWKCWDCLWKVYFKIT